MALLIKVVGGPKVGKTIVATRIRCLLEHLGATVTVHDVDEPKCIPLDSKPLVGQEVIVDVVEIRKEK